MKDFEVIFFRNGLQKKVIQSCDFYQIVSNCMNAGINEVEIISITQLPKSEQEYYQWQNR